MMAVALKRKTLLALLGTLITAQSPLGCCPKVASRDGGSKGDGAGLADAATSGNASYSQIQKKIFNPSCVVDCHEALIASQNLLLTPEKSYQSLINQPSQQVNSLMRVEPGAPARSYLLMKIEGSAGIVGERMPRRAAPLPSSETERLRVWIQQGALND
jgi:hypothetical protein